MATLTRIWTVKSGAAANATLAVLDAYDASNLARELFVAWKASACI